MKKVPLFEGKPSKADIKAFTGTGEFIDWFKGSKITDKSGKPMVMYHGGSYGTGEFKGGWFTSSYADAKHYADKVGGVVTAAFIKICKPLVAGRTKTGFLEPNQAVVDVSKSKGKYDGMIDYLDPDTGAMDAVPVNYSTQVKIISKA